MPKVERYRTRVCAGNGFPAPSVLSVLTRQVGLNMNQLSSHRTLQLSATRQVIDTLPMLLPRIEKNAATTPGLVSIDCGIVDMSQRISVAHG